MLSAMKKINQETEENRGEESDDDFAFRENSIFWIFRVVHDLTTPAQAVLGHDEGRTASKMTIVSTPRPDHSADASAYFTGSGPKRSTI